MFKKKEKKKHSLDCMHKPRDIFGRFLSKTHISGVIEACTSEQGQQ
jgi:hypothetical protein